jgi:peroxidase
MLVYFGQFIAHDMTQIVDSGASCDCETDNPECYNIPIADEDFQFIKDLCIPFARSSASPPLLDCYLKPREQMNRMTHFLDLSQLYGTTNEDSMNLRTGFHGLLKSSRCPGSKFESLPLFDQTKKCPFGKKWDCFSTGDDRAEISENLLGIHSIFLREHNRIAKRLFHLNSHWYDEKLYQEARSILIGMYQNIVYDHFLSYLLGEELVKNYKLNVGEKGYTYEYNEKLYPQVLNEFATASFRLHFLVPNHVKMASADFRPTQSKLLNHSIFNASNAYLNMDSLSRGALIEPAYKASLQMADSLHNHLFEDTFIPGKSSLGALNIQRGRDHGIPSYNRYRAFCGLNHARDFEDLSSNMDYETIRKLKEAYKSVDDIDLYVGGASERRIKGGLLGATFSCK